MAKGNIGINAAIFDYLDPLGNDELSEMKGFDLQDLLILIDDYYMQLRDSLGFDDSITFGMELEFEYAKKNEIKSEINKSFPQEEWQIVTDGTLFNGLEINSPILIDKPSDWKDLEKICSIVNKYASIGRNSGGHIHIGTQVLGDKELSWLRFIKLWLIYENVIFRFAYGEFLTARPSTMEYAKPMMKDFKRFYRKFASSHANLDTIINHLSKERYCAVNFDNVCSDYCDEFIESNTIEFRCPNGSLDPVIWQNNVNLFVRMLLYSNNTAYNEDVIEQRYKNSMDKSSSLTLYNEIYLQQALEFCDMVFTNNFDKVCFLRQYLKSFQIDDTYTKAKKFTRIR